MNFDQLITNLRELDSSLKGQVIRTANVGLTLRNWLVGAFIVEFEQNGEERAEYGDKLIHEVEKTLKIKGLNRITLQACRLLYFAYPRICQTVSDESPQPILQTLSAILASSGFPAPIPQTLSGEFINTRKINELEIPQALSAELASGQKSQTASGFSARPDFAVPVAALIQKLRLTAAEVSTDTTEKDLGSCMNASPHFLFRKLGHCFVTTLPFDHSIESIDWLLRLPCCKNNKTGHGLLNFGT